MSLLLHPEHHVAPAGLPGGRRCVGPLPSNEMTADDGLVENNKAAGSTERWEPHIVAVPVCSSPVPETSPSLCSFPAATVLLLEAFEDAA